MMMFQYLHTVDADDGDSILNIEMMMFQYSHTEDIDDVLVFTYYRCK